MPTVYIIIYSVYHHIYTLSKSIKKGLEEQGVTVKLYQVRFPVFLFFSAWIQKTIKNA